MGKTKSHCSREAVGETINHRNFSICKRGSPERRLWGAKQFTPLLLRNLLILNPVYLTACTDFHLLDTIPGAFSGTCASELPSTDLAERVFCIDAI